VAFFRTYWTDRLVDTCTGRRVDVPRGAINATTYQYDSQSSTVVYATGPCLVRPTGGQADAAEFGQESQTRIGYMLILPFDATGILPDDEFTVDTSETDAEMVGKILIVRAAKVDSYRTATRLLCELALGGGLQV
jgi:hypothetical protein